MFITDKHIILLFFFFSRCVDVQLMWNWQKHSKGLQLVRLWMIYVHFPVKEPYWVQNPVTSVCCQGLNALTIAWFWFCSTSAAVREQPRSGGLTQESETCVSAAWRKGHQIPDPLDAREPKTCLSRKHWHPCAWVTLPCWKWKYLLCRLATCSPTPAPRHHSATCMRATRRVVCCMGVDSGTQSVDSGDWNGLTRWSVCISFRMKHLLLC